MTRFDGLFLIVAVCAGAACGTDLSGPETGTLEVTTATRGAPLDPDGYALSLDDGPAETLAANASITFADLTPGTHTVSLSGVPASCVLDGPNPRSVAIPAGDTARVILAIACGEAGVLEISTSTTGENLDADGYDISVDDAAPRILPATGVVAVPDLPAGQHRLLLAGLAPNCEVAGENPRTAVVAVGDTARILFAIDCRGPAALRVTTSTTGRSLDFDGYTLSVDAGPSVAIPFGDAATLIGITPGDHTVLLAGLASNCSVADTNPRTVTVEAGGTTTVGFSVVCAGDPGEGSEQLLFTRYIGVETHLYRMNVDGSGVEELAAGSEASGGRWSPDGSRILFASDREGNLELFVMNADGSQLRRLTDTPGNEVHPVWSPDGTRIATSSGGSLQVMNADGSGAITIGVGDWPSWSPDGTRIAFSRRNMALRDPLAEDYASDIYVVRSDGSDLRNLTNTTSALRSYAAPAWSPDGSRLAFWRQVPGSVFLSYHRGLAWVDQGGGIHTVLVDDDVTRNAPVWSPDGNAIAFSHRASDDRADIRVIALPAGETSVLLAGSGWNAPTDWR